MSSNVRREMKVKRLTKRYFPCCADGGDEENPRLPNRSSLMYGLNKDENPPQYRLEASRKARRRIKMKSIINCICGKSTGTSGIGMNHNPRVASILHWMFRVNFIFLFSVMCIFFFLSGASVLWLDHQCWKDRCGLCQNWWNFVWQYHE